MFSVDSYALTWHLDPAEPEVRGRTTVRFRGGRDYVDLAAAEVLSATLNGRPVRCDAPLTDLGPDNVLEVDALFPFSDRGFRRVTDPVDGCVYLYASSYPNAAPRTMCCFDDQRLRAPVTLTVTAPPSWTCLANAPLRDRAGAVRVFEPTHPIPPLVVTAAAGPFATVTPSVHVPASRAAVDGAVVTELLARAVQFFEDLLVPYPYPKCEAVFVHEFPSLAMSSPGLVLFDQVVLDRLDVPRYAMTVVSHEVAHAWVGNLVSTSSWLVEGLAVYLSRLFVERFLPGGRPWDDLPGEPLPDRPYAPHLDRVLAVEARVGRPALLSGLRSLLGEFAHGHATPAEFEARCGA
ncbi:M1 family aminopeptidase [Saccharothrix longispora]|uniref:Aminopeptidase N n=1 Tax=Saccharothrix longispora TaxID=33920 RepID=A0ABU1Q5G0_9PSEU|nr:M1 family aminopeptidase [Saccharothrix longispora]MDR6598126.1 aminopeptidase N [Saccharothrix longispora]